MRDVLAAAKSWQRRMETQELVPTPVADDAGHARTLPQAWEWARPRLKAVPVTRVYDAAPLDCLGVPVWAAVTPLARDLTVHAGKGNSPAAARLSAVMEAVERVSAEAVDPARALHASYEQAHAGLPDVTPLCPSSLDLPFSTTYRPDHPITWVVGYDLVQQAPALVPLDAAVTPPQDGVFRGVETNGLASGSTYLEATLHALYEVVERDATSRQEFRAAVGECGDLEAPTTAPVGIASLPRTVAEAVSRLQAAGLGVHLHRLAGAGGLPVVGALLVDPAFPGNEGRDTTFAGYGCDLSAARAAVRALNEAAQSHTTVLLGARDDFEGRRPVPDRDCRLLHGLDLVLPRRTVALEDPADPVPTGDLLCDLRLALDRLVQEGLGRCVVVDLRRPHIGVPVVRALVPGLCAPYGYTTRRPGPRLLTDVV